MAFFLRWLDEKNPPSDQTHTAGRGLAELVRYRYRPFCCGKLTALVNNAALKDFLVTPGVVEEYLGPFDGRYTETDVGNVDSRAGMVAALMDYSDEAIDAMAAEAKQRNFDKAAKPELVITPVAPVEAVADDVPVQESGEAPEPKEPVKDDFEGVSEKPLTAEILKERYDKDQTIALLDLLEEGHGIASVGPAREEIIRHLETVEALDRFIESQEE